MGEISSHREATVIDDSGQLHIVRREFYGFVVTWLMFFPWYFPPKLLIWDDASL